MRVLSIVYPLLALSALVASVDAQAEWKAASPEIEKSLGDPRVQGALAAVSGIDRAAMNDNPGAFAAYLADDLAVNNPQNGVSVRGATAQRSAAGKISSRAYDRTIEYAGVRGDMVLLMGEETVVVKGGTNSMHRRFTDLWRPVDGKWLLTARQATIISRP